MQEGAMSTRNIVELLVPAVLPLLFAGCGSLTDPEDTEPSIPIANHLATTPVDDWRPHIQKQNGGKAIAVALNTFCRDFNNDVPGEGQAFVDADLSEGDVTAAVAKHYETHTILCAYDEGSPYLEALREPYNRYQSYNYYYYDELAELAYASSDVKTILTSNRESTPEKYILDRAFQVAIWRTRDDIVADDLFTSAKEGIGPLLKKLVLNSDGKEEINRICEEIDKATRRWIDEQIKVAEDIVTFCTAANALSGRKASARSPVSFDTLPVYDLVTAQQSGFLTYTVKSSGGYLGRTMHIRVESVDNRRMRIVVPGALVLNPGGGAKSRARWGSDRLAKKMKRDGSALVGPHLNRLAKTQASVQSMSTGSSVDFTLNEPVTETSNYNSDAGREDSFQTSEDGELRISYLPWQRDEQGVFFRRAMVTHIHCTEGTAKQRRMSGRFDQPPIEPVAGCSPVAFHLPGPSAEDADVDADRWSAVTEAIIHDSSDEPGDVSTGCSTSEVVVTNTTDGADEIWEYERCTVYENGDVVNVVTEITQKQ